MTSIFFYEPWKLKFVIEKSHNVNEIIWLDFWQMIDLLTSFPDTFNQNEYTKAFSKGRKLQRGLDMRGMLYKASERTRRVGGTV